MPEWLRLLKGATSKTSLFPKVAEKAVSVAPKKMMSAIPITGGYAPAATTLFPAMPAPPTTLALPAAIKSTYTAPTTELPSDDVYRILARRSAGLPDYQIVPDYMSFDELHHFLTTQREHPLENGPIFTIQNLNTGIEQGYPGHIRNFRQLLSDAARSYYVQRKKHPYKTFGEAIKDEELFNNFGMYQPDEAVEPLIKEYTISGIGVPDPYKGSQDRMTRQLFDVGEIAEQHPFVQMGVDRFASRVGEMPEDFMGTFADLTGSRFAHENSWDSASSLWPLVTRRVVPGSKLDKELQLKYGMQSKKVLDWDKYRNLLQKIENIDSLPEKEQKWLKSVLDQSYIAPRAGSFANADPWGQLLIKKMPDAAKRIYGIDITPDELLGLFDVGNPNYPELAKKIRTGMEILPGDLGHFNWFQMRDAKESIYPGVDWTAPALANIPGSEWHAFEEEAKKNWMALREKEAQTMVGLQEAALEKALPRGTALTEQNTSPDSYRLSIKKAGKNPNYGTGPGQVQVVEIPKRGDSVRSAGNNFQLNRLHYKDGVITSDLGIPEVEKYKFRQEEMDALIQALRYARHDEALEYLKQNPQAIELIDKGLSVARALHNRDLSNVRPALELVNRKHRTLGLPEISKLESNDIPKLSTEEGFYDEENLRKAITLLTKLHDFSGSRRGFAIPLEKRPAVITKKNKHGGTILPWTERILNKKASQ